MDKYAVIESMAPWPNSDKIENIDTFKTLDDALSDADDSKRAHLSWVSTLHGSIGDIWVYVALINRKFSVAGIPHYDWRYYSPLRGWRLDVSSYKWQQIRISGSTEANIVSVFRNRFLELK